MLDNLLKITRLKEELIAKRSEVLKSQVSSIQKKFYVELLDKVLGELKVVDGNVVDSDSNLSKLAAIDKAFESLQKDITKVMVSVAGTYSQVFDSNETYYKSFKEKIFETTALVRNKMQARIGLDNKGGFAKDGFIDSFISDETIKKRVKNQILSGVINGTDIKTLNKSVQNLVDGLPDGEGIVENHFRTYVYDTYSQFDRETSNIFAQELALNYMLYAGGLVDASRPFCIERNGKAFTRDEVSLFGTPADKFGGYTNKSKGEFQGKNKDYIPERDLGGYNCGHTGNWISYGIAKTLRPDIPKI